MGQPFPLRLRPDPHQAMFNLNPIQRLDGTATLTGRQPNCRQPTCKLDTPDRIFANAGVFN